MSDSPLTNREWGRMVIDGLRQLGVQRIFMSPGARSSPLIAALAETDDVSVTIHYDERGMSFAALGHAMAFKKRQVPRRASPAKQKTRGVARKPTDRQRQSGKLSASNITYYWLLCSFSKRSTLPG